MEIVSLRILRTSRLDYRFCKIKREAIQQHQKTNPSLPHILFYPIVQKKRTYVLHQIKLLLGLHQFKTNFNFKSKTK